jgi:hypothetical protein
MQRRKIRLLVVRGQGRGEDGQRDAPRRRKTPWRRLWRGRRTQLEAPAAKWRTRYLFKSGANPTTLSYNVSVVKIYSATTGMALFIIKIIFLLM